MMLQLNHNRALYNSAMQRPEKFAAKVEYELKKFLKIRLHDMSMAEVVELEQDVMPRVEALINASESIDELSSLPTKRNRRALWQRASVLIMPHCRRRYRLFGMTTGVDTMRYRSFSTSLRR